MISLWLITLSLSCLLTDQRSEIATASVNNPPSVFPKAIAGADVVDFTFTSSTSNALSISLLGSDGNSVDSMSGQDSGQITASGPVSFIQVTTTSIAPFTYSLSIQINSGASESIASS